MEDDTLPVRKVNPRKRVCTLCNKTKRVILMPQENHDLGASIYPGYKYYICDTCD